MIDVKGYIQVLTTTESKDDAQRIAKTLTERRLAGCAQVIGPIVSSYWWKGKLETAEEWLCLLKTAGSLYEELEKVLKEVHPYENPEILAMPVIAGSRDYLAWLSAEIGER